MCTPLCFVKLPIMTPGQVMEMSTLVTVDSTTAHILHRNKFLAKCLKHSPYSYKVLIT